MAKIGIIGAGSWGIALSVLLHNNGHEITVWSILEDEINMLKTEHEHKDKLPVNTLCTSKRQQFMVSLLADMS